MSKHQEADQARAIAGRYVDDHGLKFQPAMLPESMQRLGVSDAVKETANALKNMTDDKRAEKFGIKGKAQVIIGTRHKAIEHNMAHNPTKLVISMKRRLEDAHCHLYVVYVHPSALNAFLVYVAPDNVSRAEQAMIRWITDPSTPRGVSYSVKPFAD